MLSWMAMHLNGNSNKWSSPAIDSGTSSSFTPYAFYVNNPHSSSSVFIVRHYMFADDTT